jgi:hypothetical protein
VTVTCTATGSVSSTKVVMPRLKESCLVLHHKSRDTADLVCSKATIGHEHHRLQPELGHVPRTLHVDVRRFPAVRTEENETIRSITKYGRHRAAFLAHMFLHSEERFYAEKKKVATEAESAIPLKDTPTSIAENPDACRANVAACAILSRPKRFCAPPSLAFSVSSLRHKRLFLLRPRPPKFSKKFALDSDANTSKPMSQSTPLLKFPQ